MSKPTFKLPPFGDMRTLIIDLKKTIGDDYRSLGSEYDKTPSMDITIGANDEGNWNYQTGDNSYTGGAYCYPHWAIVSIHRRSNSTEVAKDILNQLSELMAQ